MFKNKVSRDPRLTLAWFRLAMPAGSERLVTPVDVSKERLGLSPAEGVQVYRDGLGRVIHVPVSWAKAHAVKLTADEAGALLPELPADLVAKRFPGTAKTGLLDHFTSRRPNPRPARAKLTRSPSSKGLGPNVEIHVLRRSRKVEVPAE